MMDRYTLDGTEGETVQRNIRDSTWNRKRILGKPNSECEEILELF